MAAAAAQRARRATTAPRRDDRAEDRRPPVSAYRAPQTRRRAARRARFTRAFVVFVVCLTGLAVGRVALSFAVVQKSLQTDAIVREERRVSAENAQLQEEVAQLGSSVNIRRQAEKQLGLVDADHVTYLTVGKRASIAEVAASR